MGISRGFARTLLSFWKRTRLILTIRNRRRRRRKRMPPPPPTPRRTRKRPKKEERKKQRAKKVINYISAQAPPSTKPLRHFCAVCGFNDRLYTCVVCGMKYCSLTCQETHRDTRCLKYTS